jgi:hypothetical protein
MPSCSDAQGHAWQGRVRKRAVLCCAAAALCLCAVQCPQLSCCALCSAVQGCSTACPRTARLCQDAPPRCRAARLSHAAEPRP